MNLNYTNSVSDFFKHPKWMMNALLGGVCTIIPLIGQVVVSGWVITQLWAQDDESDASKFPEFDFNHFMKYLTRGLWPFLVQLVAGLVVGFAVSIFFLVASIVIGVIASVLGKVAAAFMMLMTLVIFVLCIALSIGINLILVPLSLKATLTQDFAPAFDLAFVKNFLSKTWKEIILCALFMFVLGIAYTIAGTITLGIGFLLLAPILVFAWLYLQKQLYLLYLERGGSAVAKSDKLNDLPPTLPADA